MKKIAIISRHPAPYRDPFLARMSHRDDLQIDVFNELPMDEGHDFWGLKEHGYAAKDLFPADSGRMARLWHLLTNFVFGPYEFVLWSGFQTWQMTVAMLIGAFFGKRYGFAADTIAQVRIRGARKVIKDLIVRRASLIFVPGNRGAAFWRDEYAVPETKIVKGMYAFDGRMLEGEIARLRAGRMETRQRYGLASGDVVFLMVANMIATRHYPVTTEAFVRFAQKRPNAKFVIVGNGPDFQRMQDFSRVHPEIVVLGGVAFQEMLSLYAMADVYVHGGAEPASTALMIGAIARLPLLSTQSVGSFFDVLKDGISGIDAGDPTDVACFTRAFERMEALRDRWSAMGKEARALSRALDVEPVVEDFCKWVGRI